MHVESISGKEDAVSLLRDVLDNLIAFVGLIVPHLVRLSLGPTRRVLFPMSALGGAAFLVLCDGIARWSMPDHDLPVGVITAMLGAPLLAWLVTRRTA